MSGWVAKRFWTDVAVTEAEAGYGVALDGRPLRTPAKSALLVPTRALAEAIADEWRAVTGKVDPKTMPVTRMANSALDKVVAQHAEVAALLADYGDSDLLCYRAAEPPELTRRQARSWDPVLDWAAAELGLKLVTGTGVMHVTQPADVAGRCLKLAAGLDSFRLAAFHDLVSITGSLVLACAVTHGRLDVLSAWSLSRIDEDWQAEIWGQDEDATKAADAKRLALLEAARFWDMVSAA